MRTRSVLLVLSIALVALLACTGVSAAHGGSTKIKVVASGLDNPRGIDIGHNGTVYVAESGRGGDGPCIQNPAGPGQVCAGATGAVTRIRHGHQRRILTGFPSLGDEGTGDNALGPHDFELGRFGGAWITDGLGADPAVRAQLGPLGPRFGKLYFLSPFGRVRAAADIAGFEAANNPDGKVPDSDPFSVTDRGFSRVVTDAGGNDLLRVGPTGNVSVLAVFPDQPVTPPIPGLPPTYEAVPTGVVTGPDGALYMGQLTGFPFPPGAANVYRIVPGQAPTVYAGGFTNITDLAFDRKGNLYVLEIAKNSLLSGDPTGALIKVRHDGTREEIAPGALSAPTGLGISGHGDIYVSNNGSSAGIGEVLRLR